MLFDDAGLPVREIERHTDVGADVLVHDLVDVGVPAEEAQTLAAQLARSAEPLSGGGWRTVAIGVLVVVPWLFGVIALVAAVAYGVLSLL